MKNFLTVLVFAVLITFAFFLAVKMHTHKKVTAKFIEYRLDYNTGKIGGDPKLLIVTDKEVFEDVDDFWVGKSEPYLGRKNKLKPGGIYHFYIYGARMPKFGIKRNIMKIKEFEYAIIKEAE